MGIQVASKVNASDLLTALYSSQHYNAIDSESIMLSDTNRGKSITLTTLNTMATIGVTKIEPRLVWE